METACVDTLGAKKRKRKQKPARLTSFRVQLKERKEQKLKPCIYFSFGNLRKVYSFTKFDMFEMVHFMIFCKMVLKKQNN